MGRARIQRIRLIGAMTMVSLTAVTIGFSAYVTAAVYNKTKNLEPTGGEVALRSYFQKGSGTDIDPFVISRPIHFYNLSRLQNLGVFSTKTHFVLGYDPKHPDDIWGQGEDTKLTFYRDNSSSDLVDDYTLDMQSIYSLTDSVASIGDETAPFYGDFDGQGLAIKNLRVSSKPEDVGVFGYTAPGSSVRNLFLIDPVVTDDGYEQNAEIAPVFMNPANYEGLITWNVAQSGHAVGQEISPLTSGFENEPVTFDNELAPKVKITAAIPQPQNMPNVTFEYRLSSPILSLPSVQGNQITNLTFNKKYLIKDTDDYDSQFAPFVERAGGGTFHVRLSLVASSITNSGIHYSKTISSCLIVLIRTVDENDDSSYSYQVIKDVYDGETTGYTQYQHGANIGLLCGHAEGSFTKCFVYGGTISLNNERNGISPLVQESETGLIGEVGASTDSSISPQKNYEGDKDTGVLNFSKMYEDIAGGEHHEVVSGGTVYYTYEPGQHIEKFISTGSNEFQLSYEPSETESVTVTVGGQSRGFSLTDSVVTVSGDTISSGTAVTISYNSKSAEKFDAFLRNNNLTGEDRRRYVTALSNTVDFAGRQILEDTETDKRKGMGVFSLVTTRSYTDNNSNFTNELGDFVIKRDDTNNAANTYNEFYYTTAEWNADPEETGVPDYQDVSNWSDESGATYHINQPNSFPTNITSKTWNPYLERYFNYNIRCALSSNSKTNNYFYDTKSEFLKGYFSYKLVNSSGTAPTPGTAPFGVFVRNINPDTGVESAITKFDSVLEVSEEAEKHFTSLPQSYTETFVGTGKDRIFNLKHIPIQTPSVTINGNALENSDFSFINNVLTLNDIPAADDIVIVDYTYQNPTKSVVFSIKNSGGANVTIFAASTSTTGGYVGIYKTDRPDLYNGEDVTSKPDYAMYCPYYPAVETLGRSNFHYYTYEYGSGTTPMNAVEAETPQQNRLYAHTFHLKQGEYIVSSPEGAAQLVYLCAQGQNGKGNTGLSQPNGVNAITDVDFIAQGGNPKALNLDSFGNLKNASDVNVRCYFSFNSIWDNSTTNVDGNNDLVITTGLFEDKPTIDIEAGNNLTYLLADNEGRFNCSFNGEFFENQFHEYVRPSN